MKKIFLALAATLAVQGVQAQSLNIKADAKKAPYFITARDTVQLACNEDFTSVPVAANCAYTAETSDAWLKVTKAKNGNLLISSNYYYEPAASRKGFVTLTSEDGTLVRKVVVEQAPNHSSETITGDTWLAISSATASQKQSGEDIERTYDRDNATLYHSPYSGTSMPVTLTYTLKNAPHVDYLLYTPRQDGSQNGNFGQIKVQYTLRGASTVWIDLCEKDLEFSGAATMIDFGETGIDNVNSVRITVNTGKGGWASCAEMGFYQKNTEMAAALSKYFADNIYSELKPGVTMDDVNTIQQPFVRQLVYQLLNGYSKECRVGTFEAYPTLASQTAWMKTTQYNRYENPTGIYFTPGEKVAVFVEGIGADGASLIIKSFGEAQYDGEGHPESSYALSNGFNLIEPTNRGNGYISYYTDNWATAPKIKIHFAMATETGYFDLERGDDNAKWKQLLANAKSDILDIRTKRMQVAAPISKLKEVCPAKGVELATIYDNVIYREHEIMGLQYFKNEPKNRQFARPVDSGMFADGIGAAASFGSFGEWTNPDNFGFWGIGHELGHNNQVRPGLKWVGCGETTNNIYAAWVEHKLGSGYHRLEDENSGIDNYSGMRGGRFNAYLEEGIRKGVYWQLQDGPDYHGTTPNQKTVQDENYEGQKLGSVTTPTRNYDHFLKVVPLYQLTLYTEEVGASPQAFGKVIEGIRNYPNESALSDGQLQIKFMRSFCDSTKINFLPFFEKCGMLKPIHAYIEDYAADWLVISQEAIDELKAYIEAKNYASIPEGLHFLNAYNWQVFRDKAPLTEATLNEGCVASSATVQVDANVWKNAVGYETYDANGNLLHLSMFGLGAAQKSSRYTKVLFPADAKYIMAVGYDGTKVKCYEKQ